MNIQQCAAEGCANDFNSLRDNHIYCSRRCREKSRVNVNRAEVRARYEAKLKAKKAQQEAQKQRAIALVGCPVCRTWKCTRHPQEVSA